MTPLDLYRAVERILGREPTVEELPDIAVAIADAMDNTKKECTK